MRSCNNPWSVDIYSDPLVDSLFNERFDGTNIPGPPNSRFLITEDGKNITTQAGLFLITEG